MLNLVLAQKHFSGLDIYCVFSVCVRLTRVFTLREAGQDVRRRLGGAV